VTSPAPAKLISCFVCGMNSCSLYPSGHPSIVEHTAEALNALKVHYVGNAVTITMEDDGSLLVNKVPVPLEAAETKKFFMKLRHKGVKRIMIRKEVQAAELKKIFADLASYGKTFDSYENIAVNFRKEEHAVDHRSRPWDSIDIVGVKKLYRDICIFKNIEPATMDMVIGGLMVNVRTKKNIPGMLAPLTGSDDDLFIHSANVAILSILQAEHLGFGNVLIYDIGIAALLHDIGKTLLPGTIEKRQASLDEEGWAVMKKHPVRGAALLASLKKAPELAIVVAYEHHMKYDGTGYPETRRHAKKQHVISQIVAIADFYSALSAGLPHRDPMSDSSIMGLLFETAGREFNPLLVDNFVQAMRGHCSVSL